MKGRAVIDIDATVHENLSIIPGLLAAHALSGCDTVASHYGIGKGIVLKVLREGKKLSCIVPVIISLINSNIIILVLHKYCTTKQVSLILFLQVLSSLMCLGTAHCQWISIISC